MKWVSAGFPEARAAILSLSVGFRPIGTSIVPSSTSTTPFTSAWYCLPTARRAHWSVNDRCPRSEIATTMTPDVSLSSR